MEGGAIAEAARLLVAARRGGGLAERLPAPSRPATSAEASAIQDATLAVLGETAAGWKVSAPPDLELMRGIVLSSRVFLSGDRVAASLAPTLGLEAEIAFRFDEGLPPREAAYDRAEIEAAVTAMVGLEIVDSRFRDAANIPLIEKAADCMSNGGYVIGSVRKDWRDFDLAALKASLLINGKAIVDRQAGGHVTGHPIILAITLANALRSTTGIAPGQFVTTGTFTGINYAKPGDRVQALFEGFGDVEVRFD